jgi:hypothetical protein
MMLILGLLGMYFDAVMVFLTNSYIPFFQIGCGHNVKQDVFFPIIVPN